jgi:glycosyltransferase involved in cell wall biosynthesis
MASPISTQQAEFAPRVLVIPASYFAQGRTVGGGERYALEYARALARMTPVTLGLFDTTPGREQMGELEIRTFTLRHFRQRWGFPATAETRRAWRDYDVIHGMVFPTPLTDLLIVLARWRGQRVVLTDVGGGGACWSTYLQKLHRRANLNRLAHGLAFLSKYAAGFYADWPQPRTVLYGGVNLAELKVSSEPPQGYALYAGRLLSHKGVLQVIEAIGPDTRLHVVGRPYDEAYVSRLKSAATGKQVRFVFDADVAELRRQYAGANVVLQPSLPARDTAEDKSELLGLVALEAMACGKPVIITRTASLPELVVDGETGFVVPPNEPAPLRQRIEQFIADPGLSAAMGAKARRHVEQNFTWEQAARRGLDFYHTLAPPGRTH